MEKTNTKCKVKDTHICQYLGSDGCEKCTLNAGGIRAYEREELLNTWEVALSNMPYSVDELHNTGKCQFCRDEEPADGVGYIVTEFAHPEPETEKGRIMGLGPKVRVEAGTMLQIPVTVCDRCRKVLRMREWIPWIFGFAGAVFALIVLAVIEALKLIPEESTLPMLLFASIVLIFALVGRGYQRKYLEKKSKKTWFNVFQTKVGREMAEMGWFGFKEDHGLSRVRFYKKKPREHYRLMPEGYVRPEKKEEE